MFSEEEKQIEKKVNPIDITNIKMTNSYGANVQRSITMLSTSMAETVKTKEFSNLGQSLSDLREAINSTVIPEQKSFFGLFQKRKQQTTDLISNYENAEINIKKIEKDLQHHRQVLVKDIYIFEQMYEQNLKFYQELTTYITAGKKALELARNTKLVSLRNKAETTQEALDILYYNDYEDACVRLEKRIWDLETTRLVCLQNTQQTRLLQKSNQEIVDKLRSNIINTIPLWRNQMVLALGIEHNRKALEAQTFVTDKTNEIFKRNAKILKKGVVDTAKASKKGIVDIETMKKVNADIMIAIDEIMKIHAEGARCRREAEEEMEKMEKKLREVVF